MSATAAVNSAALDQLCINTVRTLSMDAVEAAGCGHPGTPMALAPLGYALWTRHLRHDPANPDWPDRDRFVLSAGHASMLLYSLLHLTGYDVSLEDLKQFRQWGSKTPGHPELGHTPGVETTTGPLGQGLANAVGMAVAESHLAALFNKDGHDVVDHRTYFIASDGDLMEGISHEAASFAGHFALGKLIGFYDDNHITIEGDTNLTLGDDAARRFESYGWHVQRVSDANDLGAIDRATEAAKAERTRPSLIIVRSHIAFGSPNKVDTAEAHGAALGADEVAATKQNLGWPSTEPFYIPEDALAHWRETAVRGADLRDDWDRRMSEYRRLHTADAAELDRRLAGRLREGWDRELPTFNAKDGGVATRVASGKVLNAIAPQVPELMGGSADLAGSTNTIIKGTGSFAAADRTGRNFHFGVREHGMGAAMNGMALHGGVIPYGATFLVFSDYMRPAIRLAALMRQHVIYVFTHDSIGLGEDGPTHQPIEHLTALRCIPNLVVLRPGDANETAEAWRIAVAHRDGPVALVLTRQKVTFLDREVFSPAAGVARGGYVLAESTGAAPKIVLISSGSEVSLALEARERLQATGVPTRVVSMPSQELFAAQPARYRDSVLLPGVKRLAVEAAHPMSWLRWVGSDGDVLGIDHFGASAPYQRIYEEFGISPAGIVARVERLLA